MSFQTILNRLAPSDYALLPSHANHPKHDISSTFCSRLALSIPRRYTRSLLAGCAALLLYLFFFSGRFRKPDIAAFPAEEWPGRTGKPPLYNQYREYERHLPAHNPDLPYPDGKHAKFIYFGNFQKGVGWGNVLQEMMYNAYFAYHVKRSFVFYNYTWDLTSPDYSTYNEHLIPARTPLSAIIAGPMVGGEMYSEDVDVPRAVSLDYFNEVCPKEDRYILSGNEVKRGLPWDPPAKMLFNALLEKVYATDARCIEIPRGTDQIFDYILFGSDRALGLWPEIRKSPIFTKFRWSPLIHAAYKTNKHFLELEPSSFLAALYAPIAKHFAKIFKPKDPPYPPYDTLDGLLVLHIRRGDFDEHCWNFVKHSSGYNGYNSFKELPEHFTIPSGGSEEERADLYLPHCYPNITHIVDRVTDVRQKVKGLRKAYIMTNGKGSWLAKLTSALQKAGEWDVVATSRDLSLSWEQKPISQALDMFVAQRAAAFIGNGFSSLTSNIVMFRMGNPEISPNHTFFW